MTRRRVLVGVDFDGTLAPLVDDPDDATLDSDARRHLIELAARDSVDVLVLSGRAHADLSQRIGMLPGAALVGEHGNDPGFGHETVDFDELDSILLTLQETTPGSRVERKPSSRAFHTRTSPQDAATVAKRALVDWAEKSEMKLLAGKDIVELTVATRTKGDVVADTFDRYDGVVYIGDDTTDETAFEILRSEDIAIKVGEGETAASYRVPDVAAVAALLGRMVEARP